MSLLHVERVTHSFGDQLVFREVSFRLLAGEHVGLVGHLEQHLDPTLYEDWATDVWDVEAWVRLR